MGGLSLSSPSLRLRTDDLAGFRAYNRIRETLVHELAHNLHADHDDHFKALNSELMKQVLAAQGGVGRTVAYRKAREKPGSTLV